MAKILLVEDNEMNRDMLARRLERRGYQVVIAIDGDQGVRLAQAEAPDLILMDMSLLVLDGWEALLHEVHHLVAAYVQPECPGTEGKSDATASAG